MRRGLELRGGRYHLLHHATDLRLETRCKAVHLLSALAASALFVLPLGLGKAVGLNQTGLEDFDRLRHLADLVPPVLIRDLDRKLPPSEAAHYSGHPADRACDAEHDGGPGER